MTSSFRCFLLFIMRLIVAGLLIFSIFKFFFCWTSFRSFATRRRSFSACSAGVNDMNLGLPPVQ